MDSKDRVRLRPKVYIRVLGNLYSSIRDLYSYVNSLLSIDRQINREVKLDTGIVSKILY